LKDFGDYKSTGHNVTVAVKNKLSFGFWDEFKRFNPHLIMFKFPYDLPQDYIVTIYGIVISEEKFKKTFVPSE
jgi:hypothetical protein